MRGCEKPWGCDFFGIYHLELAGNLLSGCQESYSLGGVSPKVFCYKTAVGCVRGAAGHWELPGAGTREVAQGGFWSVKY